MDFTNKDKIVGMLFFWALSKSKIGDVGNSVLGSKSWHEDYLAEKSKRYLNYSIPRSVWEDMVDDLPEFDIYVDFLEVVKIFDHYIGIENINFDLTLHGIDYDEWLKQKEEIYKDDFNGFSSIIGSTYGLSIVIGHQLDDMKIDFKSIERHINLNKLLD